MEAYISRSGQAPGLKTFIVSRVDQHVKERLVLVSFATVRHPPARKMTKYRLRDVRHVRLLIGGSTRLGRIRRRYVGRGFIVFESASLPGQIAVQSKDFGTAQVQCI